MLSNAVSHERTPWMESPRFWKWMMILEISAALLLPSNSKHTPGEILGLFGWLIAVIGVCLLGLWLAGRKSSFCDKWIQSNNLYLLVRSQPGTVNFGTNNRFSNRHQLIYPLLGL